MQVVHSTRTPSKHYMYLAGPGLGVSNLGAPKWVIES